MQIEMFTTRPSSEAEKAEHIAKASVLSGRAEKIWQDLIAASVTMQWFQDLPPAAQKRCRDMFLSGYVTGFYQGEDFAEFEVRKKKESFGKMPLHN